MKKYRYRAVAEPVTEGYWYRVECQVKGIFGWRHLWYENIRCDTWDDAVKTSIRFGELEVQRRERLEAKRRRPWRFGSTYP